MSSLEKAGMPGMSCVWLYLRINMEVDLEGDRRAALGGQEATVDQDTEDLWAAAVGIAAGGPLLSLNLQVHRLELPELICKV